MMLLNKLSETLLLEKSYISNIAKTSSLRYAKFFIPKKNGGYREILHPSKELKVIQKIIHDDFLSKLPVHSASFAYKKKISIVDNAKFHSGANYLLRMDFSDFFSSITSNNVIEFIQSKKDLLSTDWTLEDSNFFANLVCYKKSLTIGSVTSPLLTNAMCYNLDVKITKLCTLEDVKYTRYADDLYFSTEKPNILKNIEKEVKSIVKKHDLPDNLKINNAKTHHSSKKNKMQVTGLVITNDGDVSIGRKKKREVRGLIHKWKELEIGKKRYLTGYLAYCRPIEPNFINSLCNKYGASLISEIITFK